MILNKIKKISSYTSKRSIIYLIVAIFFAMIIETLSVGLIIPAIAFITDDDFYTKYSHVVTFFINLFPFDLEINNQIKDTKVILIIPGLIFLLVIYISILPEVLILIGKTTRS